MRAPAPASRPNRHRSGGAALAILALWTCAGVLASGFGLAAAGQAEPPSDTPPDAPQGFSLRDLRVPRDEIVGGGPSRDAIRSVDAPTLVAPGDATWVRGDTPVVGVALDGVARAYPVHVLEWHQVVNDRFGDSPVLVTYDPLTDVAAAWRPPSGQTGGMGAAAFGVSGLLDRDGFLLYDRATESLWSSVTGRAISGPRAGQALRPLRVHVETMLRWAGRYPDTTVLALPDRARIDYRRSPYSAYWVSDGYPLAVRSRDERFHAKELVLGVEIGPRSRAYIASVVTRAGGRIVDEFASRRIRIAYDGESGTFSYEAPEDVTVRSAYWFAWKSLHPETEIWGESAEAPTPE